MTVHHHHLLLRMEIAIVPLKKNIPFIKKILKQMVSELNMKMLGTPHVYYADTFIANKGITGTVSISTSHISFHIWESPKDTLINKYSKGLLQFDIYTCGGLSEQQINTILSNLNIFSPTRIDLDIFNRKKKLKLDYHYEWNKTLF